MKIEHIHHVAYRCKDAKETVEWYGRMLNMDFVLAIAEDEVPSTRQPDPYMHVFLDAGGGNVLAFFELPTQPPMGLPGVGSRNSICSPPCHSEPTRNPKASGISSQPPTSWQNNPTRCTLPSGRIGTRQAALARVTAR